MALPSFLERLRRPPSDAAPSRSDNDAVGQAKARARRRLIGAVLLLLVGVIGFPLLFETQPRPVAVDVPIVIPSRDGAAPVLSGAPAVQTEAPASAESPASLPATAGRAAEIVEREDEDRAAAAASSAVAPDAAPQAAADRAPQAEPAPTAADAAAAKAAADRLAQERAQADRSAAEKSAAEKLAADKARADKAAAEKLAATKAAADKAAADKAAADKAAAASAGAAGTAGTTDAARAQALLEGRTETKATARLVVQVGAYADNVQLAKVRQKLEGLGYKTYTQTVTVRGQRTTRVRVGPFENRSQADEVAKRVKAAGLPAAVLSL